MSEENGPIAIIPGDCFCWRPRVQFIESFQTRAAALNYASRHGFNLIVERNEGNSAIFDVMKDPDGACTSGLELVLLKTEEVLVEPPPLGWTALMLSALWDSARRLVAFVASLCARQMVPLSRRAAAVAGMYLRKMVPLSRRAAVVVGTYLREVVQLFRRTAAFASLYFRETAPILRNAAARCWSDSKSVSRRQNWAVAATRHSARGASIAHCAICADTTNSVASCVATNQGRKSRCA